uniref:Secreted protein n=1 Tax=Panagrellus redivivus TaxID=6233 RepID=A0A7E4VCY9_PANRE
MLSVFVGKCRQARPGRCLLRWSVTLRLPVVALYLVTGTAKSEVNGSPVETGSAPAVNEAQEGGVCNQVRYAGSSTPIGYIRACQRRRKHLQSVFRSIRFIGSVPQDVC